MAAIRKGEKPASADTSSDKMESVQEFHSEVTNLDKVDRDPATNRYVLAMATNSGFALVAIALALFMRFVLLQANKKLSVGDSAVGEVMVGEARAEIQGISEEERRTRKEGFRYIA